MVDGVGGRGGGCEGFWGRGRWLVGMEPDEEENVEDGVGVGVGDGRVGSRERRTAVAVAVKDEDDSDED